MFVENPALLAQPYIVRPDVDSAHFQVFVDAAQGKNAKITHDNAQSLELLCGEFKFLELHRHIADFLSCPDDHQRSVNFRNSSAGNQRNIAILRIFAASTKS
jgi:hypothetical protein